MSQFLKVETTNAARATTLIPVDQIINVSETIGNSDTVVIIQLDGPTAGYPTYTITVANAADGAGTCVKMITDAMVANPGGIVSTVVPPVSTAQVPLAQSGQQGKILITQAQVSAPFQDCTYATSA